MSLLRRAVGVMVLRFHELAEVQSLRGAVWSTTATSDWLVHLLIVEVAKAWWTEATLGSKIGPIHVCAGAEWHHQALDVSLIDSVLLVQLLQQLVVLGLLLKEHDALLVVGLSTLQVRDLVVFDHRLLMNLLNPVLELLVLVHEQLGVVGSLGRVVG